MTFEEWWKKKGLFHDWICGQPKDGSEDAYNAGYAAAKEQAAKIVEKNCGHPQWCRGTENDPRELIRALTTPAQGKGE